jgi:hypothetical protein
MLMITDPLAAAVVVFFLGAAATLGLQPAGRGGPDEMESGMVFRLLLGPACLAAIILILSGVVDRLYLAG